MIWQKSLAFPRVTCLARPLGRGRRADNIRHVGRRGRRPLRNLVHLGCRAGCPHPADGLWASRPTAINISQYTSAIAIKMRSYGTTAAQIIKTQLDFCCDTVYTHQYNIKVYVFTKRKLMCIIKLCRKLNIPHLEKNSKYFYKIKSLRPQSEPRTKNPQLRLPQSSKQRRRNLCCFIFFDEKPDFFELAGNITIDTGNF